MKKALKAVVCLLIAMTVVLGLNISNASADVINAACDRSLNPTCHATLAPGDCTEVPLSGFDLKETEIFFDGGPMPLIYPPPTVDYKLDIGDTKVEGELKTTVNATYNFDRPESSRGEVCNVGKFLSFQVKSKNTLPPPPPPVCDLFAEQECEANLGNFEKLIVKDNRSRFSDLCIKATNEETSLFSRLAVKVKGNEYPKILLRKDGPNPVLGQFEYQGRTEWEIENAVPELIVSKMHVKVYDKIPAISCFE